MTVVVHTVSFGDFVCPLTISEDVQNYMDIKYAHAECEILLVPL